MNLIIILMGHRGKKVKKIFPSMVGTTGFEPVTPTVSRQWQVFVAQTLTTNQRSFFPAQSFSN